MHVNVRYTGGVFESYDLCISSECAPACPQDSTQAACIHFVKGFVAKTKRKDVFRLGTQ